MFRRCLIILISLLWPILLLAQAVPTSYEEAKKIGDAKLSVLQETNAPTKVHHVVLNKGWGWRFKKLLKYENTIYILDKNYNLHGRIIDVPANSVIVFRRGNIRNGTLRGNNVKYSIIGDKTVRCQMSGTWERIAPLYKASELGLKPNDKSATNYNYDRLKEAINNGLNLYIDDNYYVYFPKPLMLNYKLHLYGGNIVFSKHAFDLTDGGGMYVNGVHFSSIEGTHTDDIVCGTREKHLAITTESIEFLNCHFSCNRVLCLEFVYTNPKETPFGIKSLIVKNCHADNTAKFITADVPFIEYCLFKNNTFTNFSHAPIYLSRHHSKRNHPEEADANPWAEEVVCAMCDVVIDSNIFIGKEVSVHTYYCAAVVVANRCSFKNNYLKDIVNYSDNNSKGYSAYDAYLSCVDVDYENNYVENMMSYAKDGADKPQTEIGKSKTNPLEKFLKNASRRYVNNIFICDGNQFKNKGADESSITCNIFYNVSPINSYVWTNNVVIYKDIVLNGRTWSAKYGQFDLKDNYFECSKISGNLVFPNSAYNFSDITISGNIFKIDDESRLVIFNQLYNEEYYRFSHGSLSITDNEYINSSPIYYYFVADTIRVRNNKTDKLALDGHLYLNDYTGKHHALQVHSLDANLPMNADNPQGIITQFFSNESHGSFSISFKSIPKRGVYYHYLVGNEHSFKVVFYHDGIEEEVVFENDGSTCYYTFDGKCDTIQFGQTGTKVWYKGNGIVFSSSFLNGSSNDIKTCLIMKESAIEGDYKLTYISL